MTVYPDLEVSTTDHLTADHIDDQLIGDLAAAPQRT